MNKALFAAQLNTAWRILEIAKLDEYRPQYPKSPVNPAAQFRHMTYLEIWRSCFQNQFFDFQLSDNSLLQFRVEDWSNLTFSYAYYECPYACMAYAEFVTTHENVTELGLTLEEIGEDLRVEYEEYLNTCSLKDMVTPIRYDYEPNFYKEGRHPASTMHFGHNNEIRVATKKQLLPISFVLFILRQCYPHKWQTLMTHADAAHWCKNIRENCAELKAKFWNPRDEWQLVLT